ncbi:YhgE/Pip domain-containing protein [Enterococcus raffinosus]|uniref:YhgE/Pip domain-containing protein n=1 Tax=Enterococcus raffinosus TaxID=71452 RepID=A0AAW8T4W7_9ENTE|nr:YhgE/Pip domain-containing protein [Enterococcus raffinosus]MDT2522220.1 YhgE/Pip domain-containing protein [Enterococcus raffinosus]MDT2529746.1 YhgE/Pip domain-containing protein [Enterococcus raffinosus]MDT2533407.1 YhgE/Pip domain-containing protein [Enterococcus raffinosus]MDT2543297.1 YhgE/Pip domain-containing protein [Enterococcus raffinosus]MDT2554239.1 YhgE/Pip domain-containing protein [Enterococcus raffinosus]
MKVLQSLKHTWSLFKLDWRRIFKNPIAIFLMAALVIIPSLYAWFNIKALWDPYSNTGELPIAVYSADTGAKFQDKDVEIGNEVVKNLHKNKQLGWRFVDSKEQVVEGVKSGKYYAGIYLPKEFSKDLLSFTSGDIKKPKIEYYLNQKINAIAPKITDKGAGSIQQEISQEFIKTASSTLLKVFNEIGYNIDENLVSINKVKNLILTTNDNLGEIDKYTQEVVEVQGKLPELKEKLAKANELQAYLPQVDEMGQKLITLNQKMPEIKQQASVILTLQQKIPEIQQAGNQLAQVDGDFAEIQKTMNDGINEAKQGLNIIHQVQTILPDIQKLGNQADDFAATTKDGAEKLKSAVPSISSSVQVTLQSIGEVANTTSSLADSIKTAVADNDLTPEERATLSKVINSFIQGNKDQQAAIVSVSNLIQNMKNLADKNGDADASQKLANILQALSNTSGALDILNDRLTKLDNSVRNGSVEEIEKLLEDVQDAADNVSSVISGINAEQISQTVSTILDKLINTITTAQGVLNQAQQIDFASLLNSTEGTVSNAITFLEKYQKQMPAIGQEVHDANVLLNGHMNDIVNGINTGADLYNNELPVVEQKLGMAADFMQNDWPGVKKDLTGGLKVANDKMPEVEQALNLATDLIQNDWPTLRSGIQKAANAIQQGDKTIDFGQVLKLLKLDAQKESDFFTTPVDLQTNTMYPIANNGSASTPFYTALCLWVGAVLFSSVTTTEFFLDKKDRGKYTKREQFGARMLTYLVVSVGQALIVTLGNMFLLGVYVKNPVYSVLFAVLVALAFMMIVYTLVALFGTVGKGIAIIILVLSISGGGGNYPIQVSGKFFQAVNPWLPFTHAVNLLRESAGGIYWPNATGDIIIMIVLFIVFGILGTWAYPVLQPRLTKLTKVAHESKIFH